MITDTLSSLPTETRIKHGRTRYAHPDSFWHSLYLFNISHIIITSGLIILAWAFEYTSLGSRDAQLFFYAASTYLLLICLYMLLIKLRKPGFNWQLIQQVCTDVIFICTMSYASGGLESGLGILLMISLAGSSLISKGRLALFFAAIATIGILLQEIYASLYIGPYTAQFTHAGLLSMGYFIVAWIAHWLASRTIASENLAHERSIDLANMAQINQLIIQDLQEGILVVDKHGKIRQCNIYAEQLIDLKSRPDYFKPHSLAIDAPQLASRLSLWRENADTVFDLLCLPKDNIMVRTRFVPIENNPDASVIIYLEDTSRTQQQIQQLKLAALGRLTANIAHEIRNPLSSISHAAELLEEDGQLAGAKQSGTANNSRLLRIIHDNIQRLSKIVHDVLQLSRREAVNTESIDIVDFMQDFIHDFCLTEKVEHSVILLDSKDISPDCRINFDRHHLHQISWNLCRNAWRHSSQQNNSITVSITYCIQNHRILLDFIDDGPGIPTHQIKQIFEPFFTTAANGTGLGLYIARELCETNHASLEYLSHIKRGHFRIICRDTNGHA